MKSTKQITDDTIAAYIDSVRVCPDAQLHNLLEIIISDALIKALGQYLVSEEDNMEARR
jgi:hypothetical protein